MKFQGKEALGQMPSHHPKDETHPKGRSFDHQPAPPCPPFGWASNHPFTIGRRCEGTSLRRKGGAEPLVSEGLIAQMR